MLHPSLLRCGIRRGRGSHVRRARGGPVRHGSNRRPPLPVANERLAGMVRMLGEDVQAMALRNAYAIDMPASDTLTRRRERIAAIHGLSIELALRLVQGQLPVGS